MCILPSQSGPTCGAYAVAYYIYFRGGDDGILNKDVIQDIYTNHVKIDGAAGSDPVKIKDYLNSNDMPVVLYVPKQDKVAEGLKAAMEKFIRGDVMPYSDFTQVIGTGYAITLWCPIGWEIGQPLSGMHYMLTKIAEDILQVIDSNDPNTKYGEPNWQIIGNLNNFNGMFFTGLVIK